MTLGRRVAAGGQDAGVAHGMFARRGRRRGQATQRRSDRGSMATATVPSRNGRLSAMRTRPSGRKARCSFATGGRRMYLTRASRARAS